jgi:hypothetical protein
MCPAQNVQLFTYHNPGEDVAQAVSLGGQPYSSLPTAFRYRQEYNTACSCRRAGQSWADAMKSTGPDDTLAAGDVVVTEDRAKKMSLPRKDASKDVSKDAIGNLLKNGTAQPNDSSGQTPAANQSAEPAKGKVRTVGPTFYPVR